MAQETGFSRYEAITKSDTVDFDGGASTRDGVQVPLCDAIFVGGAGIVVAIDQKGNAVNFTAAVGNILPIRARRVNSGTTSATVLVALYR